eukprot:GHRQ01016442.1.p1 GENE.GHRQ01016442.1~~GHRQ01016442.1.p1  ORF type:complete len:245 (+),score=100.07 GHRQ01016442.1:180-914(+)
MHLNLQSSWAWSVQVFNTIVSSSNLVLCRSRRCAVAPARSHSLRLALLFTLQALRQVLMRQQLPCGCQVYVHNLNTNQPAVVLSSTRSVLRDSLALSLPLQPQRALLVKPGQTGQTDSSDQGGAGAPVAGVDWAAADMAGPEAVDAAAAAMPELAAVRDYLIAARGLECRMDQAAAEACVARFRALQQANPSVGMEDLNLIITLSKLLAVSMGHEVFSMESWERAMQLEQLRKQRLTAAQQQGR